MVYKKGEKNSTPEKRPLQRAIDSIEAALKVRKAVISLMVAIPSHFPFFYSVWKL